MAPPTGRRLSRATHGSWRGRLLVLLVAAVLALGGAYGVRAVTAPDCNVRLADGTTVGLSRDEAMRATKLAAEPGSAGPGGSVRDPRVAAALSSGRPALSCSGSRSDVPGQREGPAGLTPRAQHVLDEMRATFGDLPVGGFAPGGVSSGHIEGSAHYDGRAVDVFFRPPSERNRAKGWLVAQWAVAHAERLQIATVIYDGRIWSSRWPLNRWLPYRHPSGQTDDPVLMHRDHVHVDVLG